MARQCHIRDLESGFAFASNITGKFGVNHRNCWGWIARNVAFQFECRDDDVHVLETEAGEVITAEGRPVAYYDDGLGLADFVALNAAAVAELRAPLMEAAE